MGAALPTVCHQLHIQIDDIEFHAQKSVVEQKIIVLNSYYKVADYFNNAFVLQEFN